MKSINIFAFIFLLTFASGVKAQDYINKGITGNIHFNFNTHSLDGFSDSPLCASCLGLKDGNSTTGGLKLGMLFYPETRLFGFEYRWGISAGFDILNATIENDKFLGNIITGNSVAKGIVHYAADAKISTFSVEPYLYFYPFRNIRSSFRIGLSAAVPVVAKYDFSENILTPNASFPDGSTSNSFKNRSIKGKKTFFTLPVGVRYDLFTHKNWTLTPEIAYYIPVTKFQSESNWKIKHFEIGLNTEYHLSKQVEKAVLPPKHLPMQNIPEPEIVSSDITSTSDWKIDGKPAVNAVNVDIKKMSFYRREPVPGVFVFDQNSSSAKRSPEISASKSGRMYLNISYLDSEKTEVAALRREAVVKYLSDRGFDTSKISTNLNKIKTSAIKYPELREEADCALLLSGDSIAFTGNKLLAEHFFIPTVHGEFTVNPKSETPIENISGKISAENLPEQAISSRETGFSLDSAVKVKSPANKTIYAGYTASNALSSTYFADSLRIEYKIAKDTAIYNLKRSKDGKVFAEYYIAFNNFDESTPYAYDADAVKELKSAVEAGKHIDIMGLTDNIGTDSYNSALAGKRVMAVLRRLNIPTAKVNIISAPEDVMQPNSTVEGRILNRSVIIRIFE